MSSTEDVLRLDPAMRIAREIGYQAGISKALMEDWYGQVILGEMLIGELFLRIESRVSDPQLLETLRTLRRRLPSAGGRDSHPSPRPGPDSPEPPSQPVQ